MSVFEEFVKLKRGHIICWREPILQNSWIIWCPVLYFIMKYLKDPNSLSFIRFKCILHDSAVLLPVFGKFLKLNRGDLISWVEEVPQNGWVTWYPIPYFNIKHLQDPTSLSFIGFQYMLHDSTALLSVFENSFKLGRNDLISWGEEILQNDWVIWHPILYFNIKYLRDRNSSSFIRFQCILHESAVLLSFFNISWN